MNTNSQKNEFGNGELFKHLAGNLPAGVGTEDKFTALLVTTIQFIPDLGRTVVRWVTDQSPECDLRVSDEVEFRFMAQKARGEAPNFGTAYPDMIAEVIENGEVQKEIWFEHKIDSREGKRLAKDGGVAAIGQVEKYAKAAKAWSDANGKRRILIAYCTRNPDTISAAENLPAPSASPVGILNPQGESFLWRDLEERVHTELSSNQFHGFQGSILAELKAYWLTLPKGMRIVPVPAKFTFTKEERQRGEKEGLQQAWEQTTRMLKKMLPPAPKGSFNDNNGFGVYHQPQNHDFLYQIHVIRPEGKEVPKGWPREWSTAAPLVCEFTLTENLSKGCVWEKWPKPVFDCVGPDPEKRKKRIVLRFGLPIHDWENRKDQQASLIQQQVRIITEWVLERLKETVG